MTGKRRLAAIVITAMAVLGFLAPQASAEAPRHFVDDPPAELLPADFCGDIVDFPVLHDAYSSGTEHVITHGDGPLYFEVHFRDVDTLTNTLNGKTFTLVNIGTGKDLKIVDNGDDTITITFMVVFRQLNYGPDGTLLFRVAGQFRTRETLDTNGTLTDPSDDEPVDGTFSIVKDFVGHDETAGRDFCQDMVTFIG
jgi:hypothetical protein